ncbi:hypothetical protein B1R32_10818 [Abditibacterium utsteinense]|uniref:Uncharacterized protein n=1 Tax=Abditibacterium utsteinense TaxID=1960156 RepID=A0A2S8SSM0_9BACT|nr:hypothetical protein [Abditibacterium utsteinense]PQV63814.1 hypothetical protein B1R32_10818 [Abditibacterium utsteinense]
MNKSEIERLLQLQNSAYELLLWLNKRAENEQEILSDSNLEKWRTAASCENWVREMEGMFPQALRPSPDDIPAFSHLFSSFFQTSFRLVENAPVPAHDYYGHQNSYIAGVRRRLMAGAPSAKKSTKGKAKVGESARELRLITLEELALENDLLIGRADLETLESDEKLNESLVLWTYIHELNRRAHFASQGEAVRSLWQAMDKRERENISADKVLKAHDSLLAALKSR